MCMENESDTNKTAGIDLCQGIFVDFVPDSNFAKKHKPSSFSKESKKIHRFFGWRLPLAYKYEGGGKLHLQGQGDCSLRWIISRGCYEVFHFLVVPLITGGQPISLKGWFKGSQYQWLRFHCKFQWVYGGEATDFWEGFGRMTTVGPIYVGQWCPRKPLKKGSQGALGNEHLQFFLEIQPVFFQDLGSLV